MSQFCQQCGTKNLDEAKFCKNCGFNIQEAADLIQKEKADKIKEAQKNADDKRRKETEIELEVFRNANKAKHFVNTQTIDESIKEAREKIAKQKDADYIRREQTANELEDYRKKTTDEVVSKHNDFFKGFLTFVVFAIIIIIIIKSCSATQNHNSAIIKQSVQNIATLAEEVVPVTETSEEEVIKRYWDKFAALWNDKKHRYDNPEQGIEYLSKIIEIKPNDSFYLNSRGVVYSQLNRRDLAIKDYTNALKSKPNDITTLENRGYTYLEIGNINKAKKDGKKACQLGKCDLKKYIAEWERNNVLSSDQPAPAADVVYPYDIDTNQPAL